MPDDKDMEKMHQDADLKAVGLADMPSGHKYVKEGFSNHALLNNDGGGILSSHNIRIHPSKGDLARKLLHGSAELLAGAKEFEGQPEHPLWRDPRPLIDKVQEATFGDTVGMQWITDKYGLRMQLRKAHCFTLDADTSAMTVLFSGAIASDIEAVRHLAIPPFPVTWFQLDNPARLRQSKEMGIRLTATAEGLVDGPPVPDIGWLIVTTGPNEYAASYWCVTDVGAFGSPLSFCWTTDHEPTNVVKGRSKLWLDRMIFGIGETNCSINGAWLGSAPFQLRREEDGVGVITPDELRLMTEIAGELRHIFGLLVALGAGHLGAETVTAPQAPPSTPHIMMKGKPLLPLEHKVLTIKLGKRKTVEKIAAMAITGIKHRFHEVRSHFRTKLNPDGSVKWRIPIKSHTRGDERLGRVEKTYKVER